MKSGTEIMLHAQAREAGEAHLALVEAAYALLSVVAINEANAVQLGIGPEYVGLRSALGRCARWTSTLPQPAKDEA